MSYQEFFRQLCGEDAFPFQLRFHGSQSGLRVLEIPTGLGKTKAVVVEWLCERRTTRLVYCLPSRTLTRQVADTARHLVCGADVQEEVAVIELMGGSEDLDERLRPEEPAILVGTQDILISRALNRGYAQSPFHWPMDFGLLNNDATWVFDEVQLLGEALATSTQLAAFRRKFGTYGRVPCVWMSATFERSWLNTVDFHEEPDYITLNEDDLQHETVRKRFEAEKSIQETVECAKPRECAEFIKHHHRDDSLTVMIANTVARAQEIWDELQRLGMEDAHLLHSRFRPCDREAIVKAALGAGSGVIVSTQVIEAGVDLDADLMITDAAPWASLVQRFGRVNRKGNKAGQIFWVRSPQRQKVKAKTDGTEFRPYEAPEVRRAITVLETLHSAAPRDLKGKLSQPAPYRFVLRERDLLDLFDTTPDLTGNHIDVSRFVRSGGETNVYVAWRSWPEKEAPDRRRFQRDELCPVRHLPGGDPDLKALLKKYSGWAWNYVGKGNWVKINPDRMYAGMRILLRSEAGGYDPKRGWAPESGQAVEELKDVPETPEDSSNSDPWSEGKTQTLREHTDEVVAELQRILGELRFPLNGTRASLEIAARYHDWGKAHPVFQQTLHIENLLERVPDPLLAKQERALSRGRHSRDWFRHELASALALLNGGDFLAAYVAVAHHGKVRINIRSMPGEVDVTKPQARIARGIQEGDTLFAADLGGGVHLPETALDLEATEIGVRDQFRGWSDRVFDLIDEHGPFRLAYLEMLLRIADQTASNAAGGRG